MNILSLKKNIFINKNISVNNDKKAPDTILPPSSKEWDNSVYAFSRNTKQLPVIDNVITTLIKSYLNMFDKAGEKNIKIFYRNDRKRKNVGTKLWMSKTEIKHSNDFITINIYVYNRRNLYLTKRLNKNIISIYSKKTEKLKNTGVKYNKNIFSQIMKFYKRKINKFSDKLKNNENASLIDKLLNNNMYSYFNNEAYINLVKRILKKELFLIFFKQNILFNILKYKDTYISPLKKLLKKIYNKEVIFNIVSLKNYNLDSNILTQIISTKAKDRKNRIAKLLRVALLKANISTVKKKLIEREKKKLDNIKNLVLKNKIESFSLSDGLDFLINKIYLNKLSKEINTNVFRSIKNKTISGIRLEASGRLTKRFTAQRSVFKLKYKGTLKNIESSYKGFSSKLIRNQIKSNTQYSYSGASNRIGAFGIKGWISSK